MVVNDLSKDIKDNNELITIYLLASEFEGINDLLEMHAEETDEVERKAIVDDIRSLVIEIKKFG